MTIDQLKDTSIGHWESISIEVRPSNSKNADGSLKPFYLTRDFIFLPGDKFELIVTNYADPFGKMPLARMFIKGHIQWLGEHAIAAGANVDRMPVAVEHQNYRFVQDIGHKIVQVFLLC